jgi:DNA-directed RNA polymerase specialized sigma24 family protein
MAQASVDDVEIVDWSPGPESQTLNAELKGKLEEAIGDLSEDLRAAVVLRDVQQLSTEEAAEVVVGSVPAVQSEAPPWPRGAVRGAQQLRREPADVVRCAACAAG